MIKLIKFEYKSTIIEISYEDALELYKDLDLLFRKDKSSFLEHVRK